MNINGRLPWLGRRDVGSREYTDEQLETVRQYLLPCQGYALRTTQREIEAATKLSGRMVRACLSDLDGVSRQQRGLFE